MKNLILLSFLFSLAGPAAAQTYLKYPKLKPGVRAVKAIRMEPLRRGKKISRPSVQRGRLCTI